VVDVDASKDSPAVVFEKIWRSIVDGTGAAQMEAR